MHVPQGLELLEYLHDSSIFPTLSCFDSEIDAAPPEFLECSPECFEVLATTAVSSSAS